ncbi:L-arabinose transporter permease protein [Oxobacter pfennigii]|uniref:L-arabinose transporter permease protein n=1 Tax=Oxobacter pfennigii TaxID=36849 RepID=A0A0P8YDE3_9CLOT|nr:ABC transporter permease [Oxobacter pfennigii]KPU45263.1 L-arabinose transporter permease protein [Oxobacter pfennigii]
MDFLTNIAFLISSTLRSATPLIYAALGGTFSESSGVTNIGLEGIMITGAFTSVAVSHYTGSPWLGVLGAAASGMLIAGLHAFLSIRYKADQVISGVAINLLSGSLTAFLINVIWGQPGQSNPVNGIASFPTFLDNIPFIGNITKGITPFVYIALIFVYISHFVLFKTPFGLRVRAVGEHPRAADTVGINVYKIRYICVILSGLLAGIGGASLSVGMVNGYRDGMTAGRGFIALAAMIFGKWKPVGAMMACFLFGFTDAVQVFLQTWGVKIDTSLLVMTPYIVTILALAGFIGKSTAPAADGVPYDKDEK